MSRLPVVPKSYFKAVRQGFLAMNGDSCCKSLVNMTDPMLEMVSKGLKCLAPSEICALPLMRSFTSALLNWSKSLPATSSRANRMPKRRTESNMLPARSLGSASHNMANLQQIFMDVWPRRAFLGGEHLGIQPLAAHVQQTNKAFNGLRSSNIEATARTLLMKPSGWTCPT